jgi:hypothetical protein
LAGYAGILYAPNGMHQSGVRISVFGLGGKYEYHGGAGEEFRGRFASVDALIGWSHVFGNGAVTLAIGANYQNHRVRPFDANNSVQGGELGFKVQADVWMNPTPQTLVYALGSYSTAFNTYYAVGRLGYDFTGRQIFFGPEVGGLGNDRTDQLRVGAHLTGIPFVGGRATVSGGWLHERGEGDGACGGIDRLQLLTRKSAFNLLWRRRRRRHFFCRLSMAVMSMLMVTLARSVQRDISQMGESSQINVDANRLFGLTLSRGDRQAWWSSGCRRPGAISDSR